MNRIVLCLSLFILMITFPVKAQTLIGGHNQEEMIADYLERKGEVYFTFFSGERRQIREAGKQISLDKVIPESSGYRVYAYANREELEIFRTMQIPFTVLSHPGDALNEKTATQLDSVIQWNVYPTYDGYVNLMNYYAAQYPHLCEIVNAGASVQGRQILFAKITNSLSENPNRPRVMLTSTMHGDETAGYVTLLRLIDTLLRGSSVSPWISRLVGECEIWINPLANPDGTYWGGNHTVSNARRNNANNKDLNRNFPDPKVGPYPTGPWQPENIVMMQVASSRIFTLSANFHGGAEVFNYPWDTWAGFHPDNDWFRKMADKYVDTVHRYSPSTYMDDILGYPYIPGIVNGYSWYEVNGGRQDYMNYFQGCREVTIELSATKLIPASQLPLIWHYNWKALLGYLEQSLYGIRGFVKDSQTHLPVKARISVIGRDMPDSTFVRSDSTNGIFYRLIQPGVYTLAISAPGYYPRLIQGIRAAYDSLTTVIIPLDPIPSVSVDEQSNPVFTVSYPNPFNSSMEFHYSLPRNSRVSLRLYNILGQEVAVLINQTQPAGEYRVRWNGTGKNGSMAASGNYLYRFEANAGLWKYRKTGKMLLLK